MKRLEYYSMMGKGKDSWTLVEGS